MHTSQRRLLTSEQVADLLGIHVRTLRRMVSAREFPAPLRRNRRWVRWQPDDVDAFLRQLDERRQRK